MRKKASGVQQEQHMVAGYVPVSAAATSSDSSVAIGESILSLFLFFFMAGPS